jgi:hypothetical protein
MFSLFLKDGEARKKPGGAKNTLLGGCGYFQSSELFILFLPSRQQASFHRKIIYNSNDVRISRSFAQEENRQFTETFPATI